MTPWTRIVAAVAVSAAVSAQSYEEGYASTLHALPDNSSSVLALTPSSWVWFTGTKLVIQEGTATRELLSFPSFVYGSFTELVAPGMLLFGESSTDGVWLVPINGVPTKLATVHFAYDACAWTITHALLSAKTGGFSSPNNDILAIDLTTGTVDAIAEVPGASGPLTTDARGNLFYATASMTYPPPAGSSSIYQFSAAKVLGALGPTRLSLADATLRYAGLDAAGDLVLDRDHDAFVVDWWNAKIVEIDDLDVALHPLATDLATFATASVSAAGLRFLAGRESPVFEPFQPEGGGVLAVHESSFTTGASQLRLLRARRPVTVSSSANPIPPGRFTLTTTSGPSSGVGFVMLGLGTPGPELPVLLLGAEQPIFVSSTVMPNPVLVAGITFDAQGKNTFGFTNPGLQALLTLTGQIAFANLGATVFGSAAPIEIRLR